MGKTDNSVVFCKYMVAMTKFLFSSVDHGLRNGKVGENEKKSEAKR